MDCCWKTFYEGIFKWNNKTIDNQVRVIILEIMKIADGK